MKPPVCAPIFACMYPGLCDVARRHGYALAIHGTLIADLDLIAVPWVESASDAVTLKDALMKHLGACGYEDLLRRSGLKGEQVEAVMQRKEARDASGAEVKPHGRVAWNLYLDAGGKVDLSVLPRVVRGGEEGA